MIEETNPQFKFRNVCTILKLQQFGVAFPEYKQQNQVPKQLY